MSTIIVRTIYTHRQPPKDYDASWMATEFSNVERAVRDTKPAVSFLSGGSHTTAAPASTITYFADCSSGAQNVTLPNGPAIAGAAGAIVRLVKTDSGANNADLEVVRGGVYVGLGPITAQYGSLSAVCDGTTWWLIAKT